MGLLRTGIPTAGAIGIAMMGSGAATISAAICTYLLRATFDAANQGYADGQVLNTEAEGVQDGQLTVVELDGTLAIVGNECAFTAQTTPAYGDLGFYSQAIANALGITLLSVWNIDNSGHTIGVGWTDAAGIGAGNWEHWLFTNNANLYAYTGAGADLRIVGSFAASTEYQVALVRGGYDNNGVPWHIGELAANYTYGYSMFLEGGIYTDWTLVWRDKDLATATIYAFFESRDAAGYIDNFRVPDADLSAVLQPLAKSTFTAANGTSLDAITPEVGGAWNERTGNFDIQTNRSNISATTGVRDVATVPATVADLFARTRIRKTVAVDSGEFGHCLRWTDANNFWMVHGDLAANQIEIVERNGGVETQRGAGAIVLTHSTDYDIMAIADAQDITGFLNGILRATYAAAALNENVTVHGTVGNQVGQTFDDYHVHARTAAVYDTTLDLC